MGQSGLFEAHFESLPMHITHATIKYGSNSFAKNCIMDLNDITKNEPAEAPLSTGTIARPFLTLERIFLYDFRRESSIFFSNSSDFLRRAFSSFSVSFAAFLFSELKY